MIYVVDYGLGNVQSFLNVYEKLNIKVKRTNNKNELIKAKKIILPGVGSFDYGMFLLKQYDLDVTLTQLVIEKKIPVLGVCLGMQLMLSASAEGKSKGLNWIQGQAVSFPSSRSLPTPHMGWNNLFKFKNTAPILKNITSKDYFYFLHSYHAKLDSNKYNIGESFYGDNFCSVFNKDNIFGVQFHPEKSHSSGILFLKNFYNL